MHSCCGHTGHHGVMPSPMMYYVPVCPWCAMPMHACTCRSSPQRIYLLHQEISADPAAAGKEALIGGTGDAFPSLEYLPIEGASSPTVKVHLTAADGTITTIEETSIVAGYHVKEDFPPVAPGTRMKLAVHECLARLRWREAIEY